MASLDLFNRLVPRRPEDLANHNCITFSKSSDPIDWIFRSDLGAHYNVKVNPTITVNMADAAGQVARDGGGVAWLYSYQAMPHLGDGTLISVLNEFEPDPAPAHIVYPAERLITQRARYFIDFAAPRLRSALNEINSFLPSPQLRPTLSAQAD